MAYQINNMPYSIFTRVLELATRSELLELQQAAPQWRSKKLIKETPSVYNIKILANSDTFLMDNSNQDVVKFDYNPSIYYDVRCITLSGFTSNQGNLRVLSAFDCRRYVTITFHDCIVDSAMIKEVVNQLRRPVGCFKFEKSKTMPDVTPGFLCSMQTWHKEVEFTAQARHNWHCDMPNWFELVTFNDSTMEIFNVDKADFANYLDRQRYLFMVWELKAVAVDELEAQIRQLFQDDYEYLILNGDQPGYFNNGVLIINDEEVDSVQEDVTRVSIHILCKNIAWSYLIRRKQLDSEEPWTVVTVTQPSTTEEEP